MISITKTIKAKMMLLVIIIIIILVYYNILGRIQSRYKLNDHNGYSESKD